MKNTKDAIKYGIETLNVSPDEMFNLIESSKGYDGEDYNRWLANEIIKIAEKDGVGFSQLLVKKFNIIQDMMDTSDLTIKEQWLNHFKVDNLWSVDFPELGIPLEDVDWFNGVDYDSENSFFLQEELPELYERLQNNEEINILATLSDSATKKSNELYSEANARGVTCKYNGSLFLYRMCQIVEAFDVTDNFSLRLFLDIDFLLDRENDKIWSHFLNYFNCESIIISSSELYEGAFGDKEFAYIVCKPRVNEEIQDCILAGKCEGLDNKDKRRYTRSNINLIDYLKNDIREPKCRYPKETLTGLSEDTVLNAVDALGFLSISSSRGAWLSSYPLGDTDESIPIFKYNLEEVIVYYAVSTALKAFGINDSIKMPLTGDKKYRKLVGNCIPLFLYGINSRFRGYSLENKTEVSSFDLERSDLVQELLSQGEIYYSFEAKELIDLCKGYSEFLVKDCNESVSCKCFDDLRHEAGYSEFDSLYLSKVLNLCDYIKGLYREMM